MKKGKKKKRVETGGQSGNKKVKQEIKKNKAGKPKKKKKLPSVKKIKQKIYTSADGSCKQWFVST